MVTDDTNECNVEMAEELKINNSKFKIKFVEFSVGRNS